MVVLGNTGNSARSLTNQPMDYVVFVWLESQMRYIMLIMGKMQLGSLHFRFACLVISLSAIAPRIGLETVAIHCGKTGIQQNFCSD